VFKLGRKVVFVANDASVEEWWQLFRAMYADGGGSPGTSITDCSQTKNAAFPRATMREWLLD
jgi:hypothetical protein